jgi:hypothetical protein
MSRELPPRPHLDHLRKQAKNRLADLRLMNPSAQLADAQHAIAREYGFSSWPALKAHVDARGAAASPFNGTWVADLGKSASPVHYFRAATLHFDVAGDAVTIVHVGVGEKGEPESSSHTIQVDGVERPAGTRSTFVARWRGDRRFETEERQGGAVVGGGRYEIAADGREMTISDSSGRHRIVLDRR